MIYDTIIKEDLGFFKIFIKISTRINEEQIFSRVFQDGYNEQDVEDLYDEILATYSLFNKERRELNRRATTYNQQYATENNGCFHNVAGYCFLIRRTMKKQLKLFKVFCVTNRRKPPVVDGKTISLSALEHSDLGASHTQKLLPFSEEELIPPKLKDLANLIIKFNNEVVDCVLLCIQIMRDEMIIRKDYPRVRKIYDKTISELMGKTSPLMKSMLQCPSSIDDVKDPMTREMLQSETDKWNEILAKYFHKRTPFELMIHHCIFTSLKEKYGFIPTPKEKAMWKEDIVHIQKVRKMIACFDRMKPKGQMDKTTANVKLGGKWVAKLMHWAIRGYNIDKKDFVEYFNETYQGKLQKIEYATVMAAYSVLKADEKDSCIIEFENCLNKEIEEERKKIA